MKGSTNFSMNVNGSVSYKDWSNVYVFELAI